MDESQPKKTLNLIFYTDSYLRHPPATTTNFRQITTNIPRPPPLGNNPATTRQHYWRQLKHRFYRDFLRARLGYRKDDSNRLIFKKYFLMHSCKKSFQSNINKSFFKIRKTNQSISFPYVFWKGSYWFPIEMIFYRNP